MGTQGERLIFFPSKGAPPPLGSANETRGLPGGACVPLLPGLSTPRAARTGEGAHVKVELCLGH